MWKERAAARAGLSFEGVFVILPERVFVILPERVFVILLDASARACFGVAAPRQRGVTASMMRDFGVEPARRRGAAMVTDKRAEELL
jgi:hypothetical protein